MSKELPFFKFNPASWMMGRIQRQSDSVQVAFMRLICNYWHNQCSLSTEEAELECGEEEYKTLVKYKLIGVDNDHISIKFLDEQFADIKATSHQNSLAGKASAEARRNNKSAEHTQVNVNDRSTTVQQNSTDKNKSIDIDKKESKNKKEKSIADAEASEVFNSCKKIFIDFYAIQEQTEYYFTAKDGAKLKALIKKIEFKVKEKNSGQKESSEVIRGFEVFVRQAHSRSEHWVQQNFSLSTLDSKFNEIFAQLKNGQSKSKIATTLDNFDSVQFNQPA